jgi:predicted transcriptional regulator
VTDRHPTARGGSSLELAARLAFPDPQSEHMTVNEIAQILKLNPQTVRNWI